MLVTIVSPAKTAEPIDIPFGGLTCVGLWNHVLDGGTYGRHLANVIESSVLGDDASSCYHYFSNFLVGTCEASRFDSNSKVMDRFENFRIESK